jgi:hypothetical protein
MFLGLRTFRLGKRHTADASTVLEEPAIDVRCALLQAPQLRLRVSTFRSAISNALLDCRDIREEEEEALSRARVCAASRILTSVASFL